MKITLLARDMEYRHSDVRVLVCQYGTDGAGYYNMPTGNLQYFVRFYIVGSCPIKPIVGIMGIDAKGKRG